MSAIAFERLSAQDSSFVLWERRTMPMHVSAITLFEKGPVRNADGGLDTQTLARHAESKLHLLPRYRRRLAFTPLQRQPVWIDDERFDLGFHVRALCLPRPGTEHALKELAGWIVSQHLDRSRPLWEMWLIDGLEADRFAVITKIHHCMVDGAAGMNLLGLLYSASPDATPDAPTRWAPQRAPSSAELLFDDVARVIRAPLELARGVAGALRSPGPALRAASAAGSAISQTVSEGLHLAARTALNRPIGQQRRIEWLCSDLDSVKQIKRRLGGTVNDVVLSAIAGALHRFLRRRGSWLSGLDYRVVIPVNARRAEDDFSQANRVSALFLSLPIGEPDPRRRFERIRSETDRLKHSLTAQGTELLTRLADSVGSTLITLAGVRMVSRLHPYNLIVSNVAGPQQPLYLLGGRMVEMYPQLPLFDHQGLGVAVISYCGRLCWGLVGDRELVPDLPQLRDAIDDSLHELASLAT